jgi:hypothetical protein
MKKKLCSMLYYAVYFIVAQIYKIFLGACSLVPTNAVREYCKGFNSEAAARARLF